MHVHGPDSNSNEHNMNVKVPESQINYRISMGIFFFLDINSSIIGSLLNLAL